MAGTPLELSLPRLESLLSPFVGVVQGAYELLHAPDETRLVNVGCALAGGAPVLGADTVTHVGSAHPEPRAALAAALGEAAERYSAAYVPEGELVVASATELGAAAVDPRAFALFHDRQYALPGFPFARFGPDTRLHWARGWSLLDGAPAFVPAQLVYLCRPPAAEPAIAYATSNGVACGPTLAEALLAALCELVERDAFMLAWLNRLALPRLVWSSHRRLVQLERRYFAPTGLRYSAIDLSAFSGLPAVLGIVRPSGPRSGGLGIGAGCAGSVEEAWGKALAEAFSVYRWVGERAPRGPIPDSPDGVRTFDDHLLFYAPPERAAETNFLDASDAVRDVEVIAPLGGDDPGSQLKAAISLLRRRGIAAYAVDVTAPDIREAGLWVVRVLAPQLCSLDVAHSARFLGGTRVYAAAYEAGLLERPLDFDELNPNPHPFP